MTKRMKILLSCGLVITALATVGPMVGIAGSIKSQEEMQIETIVQEQGEESVESQELTEEDKKMEKKLARLEKLRKREAELESKEILTKEEEKELSNLPVKIQGIELECGLYDYKADIYVVLNTTKVSIEDMKLGMEAGFFSEEDEILDCQNRISHLTPVYEKYKLIMEQAEQDPNTDYEAISKALYADMHAVWDIINQ